jgi:hypothetical protein
MIEFRQSLPFEDCYEDNGVQNAPNIVIVHVSTWTLEVSMPRVKYVVTSRVALVLPPTETLSSLARRLREEQKTKNGDEERMTKNMEQP